MHKKSTEPEWSPIALRRIGLSQSLHLTTAISARSGFAPKIFISRADNHDVGGEGSDAGSFEGGEGGRFDQEKGEGEPSGFSFKVIVKL
jgi:hypothetical protein